MGNNQFCNNVEVLDDLKEIDLNAEQDNFIRKKNSNESSRLDKIYSIKQADNKEEFILSIKPYNNLEAEDSVSVVLQNREAGGFYFGDGSNYKFKLEEQVIKDINQDNVMLTRVQDENTHESYSIKLIPFDDIQDQAFKQGVYEIAIQKKLQNAHDGEPHPNILQLKDCYILHSNERQEEKKCLVIVSEYFDATLTEILFFRNKEKWGYQEKEIAAIIRDLSSAVHLMHFLGISHRDIRPCNIVYVSNDETFKIANFSEAKLQENFALIQQLQNTRKQNIDDVHDFERLNTVRGVPEFVAPEILDQLRINNIQKVLNYDPFKIDIYALGVLAVLFKRLDIRLDLETVEHKIKENQGSKINIDFSNWTLSGIIKKMINPNPKSRINSHHLHMDCQKQFPIEGGYKKPHECKTVESLRFKAQKDNKEQYLSDQNLIAQEYYKLYDMEGWNFKMSEILEEYVHADQEVKKADIQYEIAEGYLHNSDLQRAQDYYEKAAYIYNSLGHEFTQKSNLQPAINYYQKAIDCVRKANNGEETAEQGLLLENIGNAYRYKGDLQKARAFQEEALLIISSIKGEASVEVTRILNNIGNVYAQLGFLKKADKRLKRALKISEQIYLDEEEKLQLQALCMCNLGEVHRLKGNLDKAKKCLEDSLEIRENLLGSGHLQVAENVENLANVYFDMGHYHQARKLYERCLVIKRCKLPQDNPEIALTLNNIGNVCKNMEELEKAKKMYEDALFILQQKFGNDGIHSYMAISFGNLGIISFDFNQEVRARGYLNKCLDILQQTVGQEHPDYQFYASYLEQNQNQNQKNNFQQQNQFNINGNNTGMQQKQFNNSNNFNNNYNNQNNGYYQQQQQQQFQQNSYQQNNNQQQYNNYQSNQFQYSPSNN